MFIFTFVSSLTGIFLMFFRNWRKILDNEKIPSEYIDAYSKVVLFEIYTNPEHPIAKDIPLPRDPKPIKTMKCLGNIKVDSSDDDMEYLAKWEQIFQKLNNKVFPYPEFRSVWKDRDEANYVLRTYFKDYLPEKRVYWNDITSDDSTSRFIFQGMGFDMVQQASIEDIKNIVEEYGITDASRIVYKVCYNFMKDFHIPDEFDRHGCNAYFSADNYPKLLYIEKDNELYNSKSNRWEYLKFVLRSAALVYGTVFNHATFTHLTVSNACNIASREILPKDHPLRKILHIFTVGASQVNIAASVLLIPNKNGNIARKGLGDLATQEIMEYGLDNYIWRSFPEQIIHMGLTRLNLPIIHQGLKIWSIIFEFSDNFVNYCIDFENDTYVKNFWVKLQEYTLLKNKDDEYSKDKFITYLAKFIWVVTAYHSHIGQVSEYFDPYAYTWSLRKDIPSCSKQSLGIDFITILGTGLSSPMLLDDWNHIFENDTKLKDQFNIFQDKLRELGNIRNERWPFENFNPKWFLSSVSI